MIHTLLLLVVCSYSFFCAADATLSDLAPAPKKISSVRLKGDTKKQQKQVTIKIPSAIKRYKMTSKKQVVQKKETAQRQPVIRYTPASTQELRTQQQKSQQRSSDRENIGRISRAITLLTDSKSTTEMQANAAADISTRLNQIKTPEGKAQAQALLKRYNLTTEKINQEASSGKAITRIQKRLAKIASTTTDIKSDPKIADDYKKLTSHHKAIADKYISTHRRK